MPFKQTERDVAEPVASSDTALPRRRAAPISIRCFMGRPINKIAILLTSYLFFIGCSNPTENFDGEYQPDVHATLTINKYRTQKYIKEKLQNFSINKGTIRCGKDSITEWRISKPQIDGNVLKAQAIRYIDKDKSDSHAIMWECLNSPENGNMFEDEISLEFTKENLIFCHGMLGAETSKSCAVLFRGKHK